MGAKNHVQGPALSGLKRRAVSCLSACVDATLVWRWCSAGIVALHPAWLGQRDSSDCAGIASVTYLLPMVLKGKRMMNR